MAKAFGGKGFEKAGGKHITRSGEAERGSWKHGQTSMYANNSQGCTTQSVRTNDVFGAKPTRKADIIGASRAK